VTMMSPSFFIHSMALRKSLTSPGAAPSLLVFAMFPPNTYFIFSKLRRGKRETLTYQLEFSTQPDTDMRENYRIQDRLDGVNPYPTFFSMSTNAPTSVIVSRDWNDLNGNVQK
jgi:hypothetical protein